METVTIHANMMVIEDIGVLITGKAHLGKSELCLALLDRGHRFVTDDAVKIHQREDRLIGTAPSSIQHFMQIDYIGILNIEKLFGQNTCSDCHFIDVGIEIKSLDEIAEITDPLQPIHTEREIMNVKIPHFQFPCTHQLPLIIETFIRNYKLQMSGYNAYQHFCSQHNHR